MSWDIKKLSDVAFFQEGPGVRKWQFRNEGIKLINVKNIVNNYLVTENSDKYLDPDEVYRKYSHFLADAGDLVMASSGATWGKTAWVEEKHLPLCMNTSMIRFKSLNDKCLNIKYLRYFIHTDKFRHQMEKLITGSAQPNFGSSHLKQIEIPLPTLEKQKRIAAILDKADAIRRKRQQAIQLADEYLRSVFLDMFGDPVTNPKGWVTKKFSNVGTLDRGKSKHRPRNDPTLLGGDHPLIQTGDVANSGGYIRKFSSTYSDLGLRQSKKWSSGTLCITIAANIAKTAILTFDACFPDSVVGFKPNNLSTVEYIQYWLSFLQKTLEANAPESAQKNINLAILRNLDVPIPPSELQQQFTKQVQKVEALKTKLNASLDQADQQFKALSQRAFAGEL